MDELVQFVKELVVLEEAKKKIRESKQTCKKRSLIPGLDSRSARSSFSVSTRGSQSSSGKLSSSVDY